MRGEARRTSDRLMPSSLSASPVAMRRHFSSGGRVFQGAKADLPVGKRPNRPARRLDPGSQMSSLLDGRTAESALVVGAVGSELQAGHLQVSVVRQAPAGAERAHADRARRRVGAPAPRPLGLRARGATGRNNADSGGVAADPTAPARATDQGSLAAAPPELELVGPTETFHRKWRPRMTAGRCPATGFASGAGPVQRCCTSAPASLAAGPRTSPFPAKRCGETH